MRNQTQARGGEVRPEDARGIKSDLEPVEFGLFGTGLGKLLNFANPEKFGVDALLKYVGGKTEQEALERALEICCRQGLISLHPSSQGLSRGPTFYMMTAEQQRFLRGQS